MPHARTRLARLAFPRFRKLRRAGEGLLSDKMKTPGTKSSWTCARRYVVNWPVSGYYFGRRWDEAVRGIRHSTLVPVQLVYRSGGPGARPGICLLGELCRPGICIPGQLRSAFLQQCGEAEMRRSRAPLKIEATRPGSRGLILPPQLPRARMSARVAATHTEAKMQHGRTAAPRQLTAV